MTKDDQIRLVMQETGLSYRDARAAIDTVAAVVIAGLVEEGKITLHGLGSFQTQRRSPRSVRNPSTGGMMDVPAKTVVKFKPSSYLRERVEEM